MKRLFATLLFLAGAQLCPAIELETFTMKGNARTLGVDFSIGRPKAWVSRLGISSGSVAAFWKAPTGLVDSMSIIFPRSGGGGEAVSKEDFRTTFDNPALEQALGRSMANAKFVRKVNLEDYKYPAGFIEYTAKYKLPSGEADVRLRNYLVYLGNVMVQIQFYLVQDAGEDRLKEFDDEMKGIVDSLVHLKD
jgi:hypothetical protein